MDLGSALKFWDNKSIIDAYFNQSTTATEDERKLKERLRQKKIRARMGSFSKEREYKIGVSNDSSNLFVDSSGDTSKRREDSSELAKAK